MVTYSQNNEKERQKNLCLHLVYELFVIMRIIYCPDSWNTSETCKDGTTKYSDKKYSLNFLYKEEMFVMKDEQDVEPEIISSSI